MEGRLINSLLQLGSGVGFYAKNKQLLPKIDLCLLSLKSLIKKLTITHNPSTIS